MPLLTVVFDLDGTLIDTAPDLVDTLNTVFRREGLAPIPFETARVMIGGGARRMIERGLRAEGRSARPDELARLFDDFIAHYAIHIADRSRPFPGLEAALDRLQLAGSLLAVCTNKLEGLSRALLQELGLTERFAAICGQDTFGIQKPDPEIVRRTIESAGGSPEFALMVGDSATDVRTARAAGIPAVVVDFGYTDVPAGELGADCVISHFADLPPAVFDLFPRHFPDENQG
jgi:phosphoglycolate phosphatase